VITLFRKTNMKLCSSHKTWYHIYQILRYQIYQILISLPSGFCQWRNMSIMFLDAVCQFKISTNVPALDMYKTPAMDLNSHQPGSAKKSAGSIHDRYLACKVKTSKKHLCFNQLQDKRRYPETFALSLMSIALFCHNASKLRSTIKCRKSANTLVFKQCSENPWAFDRYYIIPLVTHYVPYLSREINRGRLYYTDHFTTHPSIISSWF
jgi:hypothetical protein